MVQGGKASVCGDLFVGSDRVKELAEACKLNIPLLQMEQRSSFLTVTNEGSSPAVLNIVPAVLPWQHSQHNTPREIPEWLDIFPISVRVAPKVIPWAVK